MKRIYGLVLLLLLTFAAGIRAQKSTATGGHDALTVNVTGLRNTQGRVWIGLWNSPAGFPEGDHYAVRNIWIESSEAKQGTLTTTFADLPPGEYALVALHDENRNEKLDKNFLGIPKEGWGVSNGFFSKTHGPSFEGAKFAVNQPTQTVTVPVRY